MHQTYTHMLVKDNNTKPWNNTITESDKWSISQLVNHMYVSRH